MGVSNKNAQDNIQPKGNKKDLKKPLQVLHISKKDTQKKSQEIQNEQTNSQEKIEKENIAIKPQIIKDESIKEIEDGNENSKAFDITQQDLNKPLNFSEYLSCLCEVPEEVFYCPLVGYYLGHFYY